MKPETLKYSRQFETKSMVKARVRVVTQFSFNSFFFLSRFAPTPMKSKFWIPTIKRVQEKYHNIQAELKREIAQVKFSCEKHKQSDSRALYSDVTPNLQAILGQGWFLSLYVTFSIEVGVEQPYNYGSAFLPSKGNVLYTISPNSVEKGRGTPKQPWVRVPSLRTVSQTGCSS